MDSEKGKKTSIIQIIQKMVQENEPEEKIVSTLISLGVSEEQAKRLLLIAQADTFTLLGSELEKMVDAEVAEKQAKIEEDSKKFIEKELEEKKEEVKKEIEQDFLKRTADLTDKQAKFQDSVNESISKIAKLNEDSYLAAEENKKTIDMVQKDLTETKLKGVKVRRSLARNILIVFGIICFMIAVVMLLYSIVFASLNLDYLTGGVVLALVGTIMVYLSMNI